MKLQNGLGSQTKKILKSYYATTLLKADLFVQYFTVIQSKGSLYNS